MCFTIQTPQVKKIYECILVTSGLTWKNLTSAVKMGNSPGHNNNLGIPSGKGPHQVGCSDLMVGHTVQGTFFRLYYPCQTSEGYEKPDWVPCREYFNGLSDFMKMNRTLSERIFNYLFGSYKIPAAWNASFKPGGKYPVIIFSHGLGAFRTLYSAICAELASQGFVVAAVEHRDESSSATFYYKEKSAAEQNSHSKRENFRPVSDDLEEQWMYYRVLKPGESEFPLRNKQVKQRAEECIRTLNLLIDINAGKSVTNVLQSDFDWTTLENSLDLCRIAVMGHSFGGATVIECLCKEVTFKGTVHQSFPDFTFLTGNWIGKILKLKGEIDPHLAMDLCNHASLAFLQRHLSLEKNFNQWDHLIEGKDDNLIPGTNITIPLSSM
ncbi:platelet-activating factor acetylhydrolase isoform X2 [Hoplias malabaricus]|uniref:platelet-activating factor acetylhydrolase isoform X2 n=1 Tax=Hoplias malabaricus TaxID=27720 RepID=UPI00346211C0